MLACVGSLSTHNTPSQTDQCTAGCFQGWECSLSVNWGPGTFYKSPLTVPFTGGTGHTLTTEQAWTTLSNALLSLPYVTVESNFEVEAFRWAAVLACFSTTADWGQIPFKVNKNSYIFTCEWNDCGNRRMTSQNTCSEKKSMLPFNVRSPFNMLWSDYLMTHHWRHSSMIQNSFGSRIIRQNVIDRSVKLSDHTLNHTVCCFHSHRALNCKITGNGKFHCWWKSIWQFYIIHL